MQKLIILLLFASVCVGALMPAPSRLNDDSPRSDATAATTPIVAASASADEATHVEVGSGTLTLPRAADGHFYAEAQVNGMPVRFLIDTGASSIALSRADAQRAFVATDPADDHVIGSGASGEVRCQFVKLDRVKLGPAEARDIDASVLAGGTQSLLGQSFLSQFEEVSIEGDQMVLR